MSLEGSGAPQVGVCVRRAAPGDEAVLRSLRIAALTEAPDAFGSTLDRELGRTHADWSRWISHSAPFIAELDRTARGIAAGIQHETDPDAAFLVSMWVDPALRGTGTADALVRAVLEWAEEAGKSCIWLHVGSHNDRARRLYERHGFVATGVTFVVERNGVIEVEMRRTLEGPGSEVRRQGS